MKFVLAALVAVATAQQADNLLNNRQKNKLLNTAQNGINKLQAKADAAGVVIDVNQSIEKLVSYGAPKLGGAVKHQVLVFEQNYPGQVQGFNSALDMNIRQIRAKALRESGKAINKVQNKELKAILGKIKNLAKEQSDGFVRANGGKKAVDYGKAQVKAQVNSNQKEINQAIAKGSKLVNQV